MFSPLLEQTDTRVSRPLLALAPRHRARPAPVGWTVEQDRIDENAELSAMTINHRTR